MKNKENVLVGGEAVLLKAVKENETLTDHQGASGDCGTENSEARSPEMHFISTSSQRCNRTEVVQPSVVPLRAVSRIPKFKQRHAREQNTELKSGAKDSSEGKIPEDLQRFNTQQQTGEKCPLIHAM